MQVRFWGVRGSVASSGAHVAKIGGNTSCLEVEHEGNRIIFDAGTGLRGLGETLGSPVNATMFFSHLHWDHVQGFPFFGPAYLPTSQLKLFGPSEHGALERALARQMEPPNFPVTLSAMRAQILFGAARENVTLELGRFRVTPFALPHPNGCLGYRIEADGRVSGCAIEKSSGSKELDDTTCRLIVERFRFRPSLDPSGRPVPATMIQNHIWVMQQLPPDEDDDQRGR